MGSRVPARYGAQMRELAPFERRRDGYRISTERALLDRAAIHAYLVRAYWATGISRKVMERSFGGSICFGVYAGADGAQVGFARVVTDGATFAWLADVYILESHRGRGIGKWLVGCVIEHPHLQGLRRFMLGTRDAHGLYAQVGWEPLAAPSRFMAIPNRSSHGCPPAKAEPTRRGLGSVAAPQADRLSPAPLRPP